MRVNPRGEGQWEGPSVEGRQGGNVLQSVCVCVCVCVVAGEGCAMASGRVTLGSEFKPRLCSR